MDKVQKVSRSHCFKTLTETFEIQKIFGSKRNELTQSKIISLKNVLGLLYMMDGFCDGG